MPTFLRMLVVFVLLGTPLNRVFPVGRFTKPVVLDTAKTTHYFPTGNPTANGERYDPTAMTAANKTLPFHTWVEFYSPTTGKTILVRINDRGPYNKKRPERIFDLTPAAVEALGHSLDEIGRAHV